MYWFFSSELIADISQFIICLLILFFPLQKFFTFMCLDLSIFYFMDCRLSIIFEKVFSIAVDKFRLPTNLSIVSLCILMVSFSCLRFPSSRLILVKRCGRKPTKFSTGLPNYSNTIHWSIHFSLTNWKYHVIKH